MLNKKLSLMLILLVMTLLAVGCSTNDNQNAGEKIVKDEKCQSSMPGPGADLGQCEMVLMPGYFYNDSANECEYWKAGGSGCIIAPFNSMKECQKTCIINK